MTLDTNVPPEKLLTTIQQEYKILAEYKMLQSEDIGGIYVIPSRDNSFLWFGVIFIRDGYYKDAIFRFNISLPDHFPEDKNPPTIIFQSEIFHPIICPFTGTLDISDAFSTWIEGQSHLWQLLKYIQFIFLHPEECLTTSSSSSSSSSSTSSSTTTATTTQITSSSQNTNKYPNPEAAQLLSQNKGEFLTKVKNCVYSSIERVYDPPPTEDKHYITFEKFEEEIHRPVLENIKKNKDITSTSPQSSGLSWVKEGEFKPLSRD